MIRFTWSEFSIFLLGTALTLSEAALTYVLAGTASPMIEIDPCGACRIGAGFTHDPCRVGTPNLHFRALETTISSTLNQHNTVRTICKPTCVTLPVLRLPLQPLEPPDSLLRDLADTAELFAEHAS